MKKLCLGVFFGYCFMVIALNISNAEPKDVYNDNVEPILWYYEEFPEVKTKKQKLMTIFRVVRLITTGVR